MSVQRLHTHVSNAAHQLTQAAAVAPEAKLTVAPIATVVAGVSEFLTLAPEFLGPIEALIAALKAQHAPAAATGTPAG